MLVGGTCTVSTFYFPDMFVREFCGSSATSTSTRICGMYLVSTMKCSS